MKPLGLILSMIMLMSVPLLVKAQGPEAPQFTLASEKPVIRHGEPGKWDGRYTDPGAALYHDKQFHMFRNGFKAWPDTVQIGYLTSPDGMAWTEVKEEPVLTTARVPFAEVAALASSALVEDDGTWVLYFYTWNRNSSTIAGEIGRATAPDPAGPWTVHPRALLTVGSQGSWDSTRLTAPSVHKTDKGYVMYYSGSMIGKNGNFNGIGMAHSANGIAWTKYDDPATTTAPFAESDPILAANNANFFWHQPRVEHIDDGWVMILREQNVKDGMKLYYATSQDGTKWAVVTNPILKAGDIRSGRGRFWYTATAYHDSTLYLYIEVEDGTGTSIYLTRHNITKRQ